MRICNILLYNANNYDIMELKIDKLGTPRSRHYDNVFRNVTALRYVKQNQNV